MQFGPGRAYKDGSLGRALAFGPGSAYKDGSLGGGMMVGPGRAIRDGSLGCSTCGTNGLGVSDVKLGDLFSMDILIGGAIGAVAMYFYMTSEGAKARG